MKCEHLNFKAQCNVNRLSKREGGEITGYAMDVMVECADCGLPFKFLGSRHGSHPSEPRLSFDGRELRAPIAPVKREPIH